jgi:hypothetical protein
MDCPGLYSGNRNRVLGRVLSPLTREDTKGHKELKASTAKGAGSAKKKKEKEKERKRGAPGRR